MSNTLLGGRPYTMVITVGDEGGRYSLPGRSAELIFRTRSGTAQLFWNQADFDAQNLNASVVLNGDVYGGEFRARASCADIWLSGSGAEIELTVLTKT